jgi:hypothetical protein
MLFTALSLITIIIQCISLGVWIGFLIKDTILKEPERFSISQ